MFEAGEHVRTIGGFKTMTRSVNHPAIPNRSVEQGAAISPRFVLASYGVVPLITMLLKLIPLTLSGRDTMAALRVKSIFGAHHRDLSVLDLLEEPSRGLELWTII